MFIDFKGTVQVVCQDGSLILLLDVLFVLGLGVNLLSAQRVCQNGLKGTFNQKEIYFSLNKKKIIKAFIQNGLYIINHIANSFNERAFLIYKEIVLARQLKKKVSFALLI